MNKQWLPIKNYEIYHITPNYIDTKLEFFGG